MTIRGIVFDIGGVLEITPKLGVTAEWEERLRLQPGELDSRLEAVWEGGSLGKISEAEVYATIQEIMGLAEADVKAMMDDMWREYLGTLNVELDDYFRGLRPRFQTAILSNSFVGAREREQAHYQFEDSCDFIIYSHEVGLAKPDRRIYELTCERLELEPGEVIFVDDVEENIEAAQLFGMRGILFEDNDQVFRDIENCIVEVELEEI
jgi:putative hydrolase of the HAD superfamily